METNGVRPAIRARALENCEAFIDEAPI